MKINAPAQKPGIRAWLLILVLGLGAAAVVFGAVFVLRGSGEDDAAPVAADGDQGEDDDVFDFSEAAPLDRGNAVGGTGARPPDDSLSRIPERLRARIQLAALGARPPSLTPEQLVATLQENRAPLRECVRAAGGFRAMRDSLAASGGVPDGGGPRARPSMRFDVGPDGRVVPGSVSLEPSGPAGLSSCVGDALAAMSFPPPGGDGAHVELPLGVGRGGGRRRLDGSVGEGGAGYGRGERRTRVPPGEDRAAGSATVPAVAPPSQRTRSAP